MVSKTLLKNVALWDAPPLRSTGVPNLFGVSPPGRQFADEKPPNKLGTPTGRVFFNRVIEGGEYIQFLRYALGSARETRSWYYKARKLLTAEAVRHRIALCDEIIALLVVTIKHRRARRRK